MGGEVGAIFTKRTDSSANWAVQHRSSTNADGILYLNLPNNEATGFGTVWNGRATSTDFTVGTSTASNANGGTYVAYIFADNSSEDAANQMIKCGSYTGSGTTTGPVVDLGWPAQFILFKNASANENWQILDSMRNLSTTGYNALIPNLSAEIGRASCRERV